LLKFNRPTAILYSAALLLIFITGCVGPLVSHETARTVGRSAAELTFGEGSAGTVAKFNYGVLKDLDLGIHIESLSAGVRAKYAFVNAPEGGFSFAAALGTGETFNGKYNNVDLIASLLREKWEPYGTFRFVRVDLESNELDSSDDTGLFDLKKGETIYTYGQVILGSRYWFDPHWIGSLEASSLISFSKTIDFDDNILVGAALIYKFL